MPKYKTVDLVGYWFDDPLNKYDVSVALGSWDGIEDAEDREIFYYMDGKPLKAGMIISDSFVVERIENA